MFQTNTRTAQFYRIYIINEMINELMQQLIVVLSSVRLVYLIALTFGACYETHNTILYHRLFILLDQVYWPDGDRFFKWNCGRQNFKI